MSEGLIELNRLVLEEFDQRHPDYPKHLTKPLKKYSDSSANNLTQSIIKFLSLKGHLCERVNSTGRPLDNRKVVTNVIGQQKVIGSLTWIPGTAMKGTADVSAIINGVSIRIEIKHGKDRQSNFQKEYQRSVEASGGVYLIVRSFQEFFKWYNSHIENLQRRITNNEN